MATKPNTTDRLAALVALVRKEEREQGCPEAELCTAERFEAVNADTFANEEAPCRVFYVRVITLQEANAEGIPAEMRGDVYHYRLRSWLAIDAVNPNA
jgi:hypothetical protein